MAHTFDAKARTSGNSNPVTLAYTCGSGATLLVIGIVTAGTIARSGGNPTYNGITLDKIYSFDGDGNYETISELWYMNAPPTGSSYTISIPNSGGATLYVIASSYKAQSGYNSMLDVYNTAYGIGISNPSCSVTTTKDGDVIVDILGDGYYNNPSANSDTLLYSTDDGGYSDNAQYCLQSSAGSKTLSWTCASDDWRMIVAAFKEVTQQSKHGGTFANDYTVGTVNWANPSNAGASDNVYTSAPLNSTASYYLKITNFGFTIPSGATINWVKVAIEKSASNNYIKDNSIRLVKGGTISGDNKADWLTYWDTTDSSVYYGGTDTWGLTLTYSDINSSNFGVVISAFSDLTGTAYIDDVIITVDYSTDITLTIANSSHSHSTDNLGLTQVHNLSLQDSTHSSLFDSIVLTQVHNLSLENVIHLSLFDNTDLIQNILLILQDLTHSHQIDNVTLIISGLVIQDLIHSSLIDNINLTQIHNLTLQDLTHSNLIDSVNLITGITLVLSDLIHSGVIDSVNLTQVHNLVVQNTTHQNQIENIILEVMLYIQNATHNGVIDNVVLTQVHNLIIDNLSHLNEMDNLDLVQQIVLATQDICHSLNIDTIKLLAWLLKEDSGAVWNRQSDEGSSWKKRN